MPSEVGQDEPASGHSVGGRSGEPLCSSGLQVAVRRENVEQALAARGVGACWSKTEDVHRAWQHRGDDHGPQQLPEGVAGAAVATPSPLASEQHPLSAPAPPRCSSTPPQTEKLPRQLLLESRPSRWDCLARQRQGMRALNHLPPHRVCGGRRGRCAEAAVPTSPSTHSVQCTPPPTSDIFTGPPRSARRSAPSLASISSILLLWPPPPSSAPGHAPLLHCSSHHRSPEASAKTCIQLEVACLLLEHGSAVHAHSLKSRTTNVAMWDVTDGKFVAHTQALRALKFSAPSEGHAGGSWSCGFSVDVARKF